MINSLPSPINATGILLHGSLKEPPLAEEAVRALNSEAYSSAGFKKAAGSDYYSYRQLEELICTLTEAEDVRVVNNLMAAAFLVFHTLARGREIIVSRRDLHQNAFSASLAGVAQSCGAYLKEVGGKETAAPGDYQGAVTEQSALFLTINSLGSSKRETFHEGMPAGLGKPELAVVGILDNAALLDLAPFGLPDVLQVQKLITGGFDIVVFRGDKLLGGPPAGIIAGKGRYLSLLKQATLASALSAGRIDRAMLEATLALYLDKEEALKKIPLLSMISAPPPRIEKRAWKLVEELKDSLEGLFNISMTAGEAHITEESNGLGALPSFQVSISSEKLSAAQISELLTKGNPPVIPCELKEAILLDLRSVQEKEDDLLLNSILDSLGGDRKEIRVLDTVPSPIWTLNEENTFIYANKACENFWGLENSSILGKAISEILAPGEAGALLKSIKTVMKSKEKIAIELKMKSFGNKDKWMDIILVPLLNGQEEISGVTFTAHDVTERKRTEEELKYISMHDSLTGLYNRVYFEEEMRRLNTHRHYPLSIIVCDVDGLKFTNDILGHEKGDKLLKTASNLIKKPFRTSDVVARVGGDEFAIILPRTNEKTAEEICERIKKNVEKYNQEKKGIPLSLPLGFATGEEASGGILEIFKNADSNMYKNKFAHGKAVKRQVFESLLEILAEKDFMSKSKAERLQEMLLLLGQAVGMSPGEIKNILLLSRVYDIGKVNIDDSILFKEGALSDAEWEEIKRHPETGYRIARFSAEMNPIADFIMQHHEWWDGNGYPAGLKGKDIHLYPRILAIVDAYQAMTSHRPYRELLSREEAIQELKRCSGIQFDPRLVEIFINLIEDLHT